MFLKGLSCVLPPVNAFRCGKVQDMTKLIGTFVLLFWLPFGTMALALGEWFGALKRVWK
jgi:hypothetical protein